jgi:hypothetical protein
MCKRRDLNQEKVNRHYSVTPNNLPAAAVSDIANIPQKVTRTAPLSFEAPPAHADSAPRSTSETMVTAVVLSAMFDGVASVAANKGVAAPTENAAADDSAA